MRANSNRPKPDGEGPPHTPLILRSKAPYPGVSSIAFAERAGKHATGEAPSLHPGVSLQPVRAYPSSMRARFLLGSAAAVTAAVILASVSASPATAQAGSTIPPGNSAITQYLEPIPTATGSKPSTKIQRRKNDSGPHSGAGTGGSTGGGPGGGGSGGSGALTASVSRAFATHGTDGTAAANFARSTAPSAAGTSASTPGATSSPASSVFKALTGSTGGGGLGWLLPALLIVVFVGGGVGAFLRHRATSTSDA